MMQAAVLIAFICSHINAIYVASNSRGRGRRLAGVLMIVAPSMMLTDAAMMYFRGDFMTTEQRLAKANALMRLKDYDGARREFREAKQSGAGLPALDGIAECGFYLNDTKFHDDLAQLYSHPKGRGKARFLRGQRNFLDGNYADARDDLVAADKEGFHLAKLSLAAMEKEGH